MTAINPLQLHLFDATPNHETISQDRRRRLLTLTGMLLSEAACDGTDTASGEEGPFPARGTKDE